MANPNVATDGSTDVSISAFREIWPMVAVAAGLAIVLVWAEEHRYWLAAQATVVAVLLLLSFFAWVWWERRNKHPQFSITARVYYRAIHKVLLCVAIGIAALILNAIRIERWQNGLVAQAVGYGILFAGAAFISGVLLGYLFGLRPSSQINNVDGKTSSAPAQSNLEEIADWLTKLILGAGLVSLTKLHDPILQFATFMAGGVDPMPTTSASASGAQGNPAIALAIMGFFSTNGLLYGYLWTRYEQAITSDKDADVSALSSVDRWLTASGAPDERMRAELVNAINSASPGTKMRIFEQAELYRKPSTRDVNDRSLAVFQALVENDAARVFHRNRGEYAMALMGRTKDPKSPDDDWSRARDLLSEAIRIRDRSGERGWLQYELARAVCEIYLDANFKKGQPSNPDGQQSIAADLHNAKDISQAESDVIDSAHVIPDWKHLNPVG
jgi:hypothetical protein